MLPEIIQYKEHRKNLANFVLVFDKKSFFSHKGLTVVNRYCRIF